MVIFQTFSIACKTREDEHAWRSGRARRTACGRGYAIGGEGGKCCKKWETEGQIVRWTDRPLVGGVETDIGPYTIPSPLPLLSRQTIFEDPAIKCERGEKEEQKKRGKDSSGGEGRSRRKRERGTDRKMHRMGKGGRLFYREGERGNWRRRLRSGANYRGPLERYVRNKVEMGWDAAVVGVGGARRGWGGERYEMSLRPTLPPACLFTPVIIVTVDISGGALSPALRLCQVIVAGTPRTDERSSNSSSSFRWEERGGRLPRFCPSKATQQLAFRCDVPIAVVHMYRAMFTCQSKGTSYPPVRTTLYFFSPFLCSCRDSFRSEKYTT